MKRFSKRAALLLALLMLHSFILSAAASEKESTEDSPISLSEYVEQMAPQWQQNTAYQNGVPMYFQTDYPDTPYGSGTIATSGCGITCLAMAATYLTDEKHTPDELAAEYGQLQMSNVQRINYAIEDMGLPLKSMPTKWYQMSDALRTGRIVIVLVKDSIFSSIQHFLVLTGITEDGMVMVIDPYKSNYNNPGLIQGYLYGFPEEELDIGFDGGWIFERKDNYRAPDVWEVYQLISGNEE